MNIDLNDEAHEYGRLARQAFESAGGDALVQRAEADPERREAVVSGVLADLAVSELDPRGSADELEAAAALCRSAGWWAVPDPVAERLARPRDLEADGLVVVDERRPAGPLASVGGRWVAVTLDGGRHEVTAGPSAGPRTSAFLADLDLRPLDVAGAGDLALGLVLPCWTLLGMLDRALALTSGYVVDREQFGKPLASFQGVQFQLTDAEVERAGVEELAKYALWSVQADRPEALDDALALRLAALEAATGVFRVCHQLHGAIGVCDETTLSWLSRYSQPLRRLPWGPSGTRDRLTRQIGRRGLTGLFSESEAR